MSDTRRIMAACLRGYRKLNKHCPTFFTSAYSACRYRMFPFFVWDAVTIYSAQYDTETNTLCAEAYDKQRELVQIMIFE